MPRQKVDSEAILDAAPLAVAYSGPALASGMMDVSEFLTATAGIRDAIVAATTDINSERIQARITIDARFEKSSFHFMLSVEQVVTLVHPLLSGQYVAPALEIVKALFGENGVISIFKTLKGRPPQKVESAGSGNVQVIGDNNSIIVCTAETAKLYDNRFVRDGIRKAVRPLFANGIERAQFKPRSGKSEVSVEDLDSFLPDYKTSSDADAFEILEEIVEVVKPALVRKRRWRLQHKGETFGAMMEDVEFERRVLRRELLFGTGDKLAVRLARRSHKNKRPEYFIMKVLSVIRPPEQLGL